MNCICFPGQQRCKCSSFLLFVAISKVFAYTDNDLYLNLVPQPRQIHHIELQNDGSGLGFGIVGGKSTGTMVKTILTDGVAGRV